MSNKDKLSSKKEIHRTLGLSNFCTRQIGLSFIDDPPNTFLKKVWADVWLFGSGLILFFMLAGEISYVTLKFISLNSVVEFVSLLHIAGYDTMSFGKFLTIWYKRDVFRLCLNDLVNLWPMATYDKEAAEIKRKKLASLRVVQFCYSFWNFLGLWLYNLTPVAIFLYRMIYGIPGSLGFIWNLSYPFDKTQPVYHELVFLFEMYGGVVSVWSMLGSDILFMTMASHISMLLNLLQLEIRHLATQDTNVEGFMSTQRDCYDDIVSVVKIHQRIISYGNELEDAFSIVNLINVVLSSINICCVVFNILLDPWMAMSNKFFLGAALTQVGILCWYADEISTARSGIATAAYESGWYNSDIRCRKALLVLIQRSQKPLHFTAYKFRSITMSTYSSILATSYSYFALLYTMYRND